MRITIKNFRVNKPSSSPVTQIFSTPHTLIYLNHDGKIFTKNESHQIQLFYCLPQDFITAFDLILSQKQNIETVIVGTENGTLQLLTRSGSVQKQIKEAHKGSILLIKISSDFQTIATAGEDCSVKLWSRSGMLRSEIYRGDSPSYAFSWGCDDQVVAIGGQKILTFKSIKPGTKDVVVRASDSGSILQVNWSKQENILFTTSEDCRYRIWDSLGRNSFTSPSFEQPFTMGCWTQNNSDFLLGNINELFLVNKTGQIASRIASSPFVYSLNRFSQGNRVYLGLTDGSFQVVQVNSFESFNYKNMNLEFESNSTIRFSDIHSDYQEVIDFEDKNILHVQALNDKVVVLVPNQCYVYSLDNLITPVMFETKQEPLLFTQASKDQILIAFQTIPPTALIFNYSGQQVSQMRFPSQSINKKFVSLSFNCLALIDPANPKILQLLDSRNQKLVQKFTHENEILEIKGNNAKSERQRKFLLFDQNKDLYVYFPLKNVKKKVACMVNSFQWHEHLDVFVYSTNDKLQVVYAPNVVNIDKQLLETCSARIPLKSRSEIIHIYDTTINAKNSQGFNQTFALNQLAYKLITLLEDENMPLEKKIAKCVKLARFLKHKLIWGILAVFLLENRDSNSAEICLGALENLEKVQYIYHLNNMEDEVLSQAKFYQLLNKQKEAESLLVKENKFYELMKLFISKFEFRKALKLATKVKSKQPDYQWLVDYVILHRKRYLKEVGLEQEHDEIFKGLSTKKTL